MNPLFKVSVITAAVLLSACSALQSDKVDYRSAGSATPPPPLEVPPDLTQLSKDTRYAIVGGAVSASGTAAGAGASTTRTSAAVAALAVGDVRIERDGNQRWLVVKRPADKLWDPVKDFWQENGFLLSMDRRELGIMETDWAENHAKIPDDIIHQYLGKLLDSLYSTGERDKFRTRLEIDANGDTDIFISHRGMVEVYNSDDHTSTVWQPRPSDPELEAEFLRRLMMKLGVPQEQAKVLVAQTGTQKLSSVSTVDGHPVVSIPEDFDHAWRRVGLALDRTGFTVEDRDRKSGIYFVRYVSTTSETSEPGFFSKLFSSSKTAKTNDSNKYQISVHSEGATTTVSVLDHTGTATASDTAQRIVKVIADDLK